jgi:AraC-like DNA-binding protein
VHILIKVVDEMINEHSSASSKSFVSFRYFKIDRRARQWGMYVTTCGACRVAPYQPYPPVEHPPVYNFDWNHGRKLSDYQIVYVSEGAGTLETDKLTTRIHAGDAMLLSPNLWHRYRPDATTGWHESWVGFSGETIQRIFREGFFSNKNAVVRIREEKLMLRSFDELFQSARENVPALQQVMAGRTSVLLSLVCSSGQPLSTITQGTSQMVERVRSMMTAEETRDKPLESFAKDLKISYSTFRRTFREHTGMSPHQYRLHLKISAARELLRSTSLTVKEISYRCGFEDEQYFCRLFKRQTGSTPGQFRVR